MGIGVKMFITLSFSIANITTCNVSLMNGHWLANLTLAPDVEGCIESSESVKVPLVSYFLSLPNEM